MSSKSPETFVILVLNSLYQLLEQFNLWKYYNRNHDCAKLVENFPDFV